jgi:ribosome recycling factor
MSAVVVGIPQIITEAKAAMDRAVESARREFSSIRTGKASANLLDTVRVEAYGQAMPLNQLASVAAPEPRLLTVTPWDKGQLQAIEKAIRESDLGLNPSTQGGMIRVPLPQLNEQRRKDLVKVVHKMAEEGRIAVRHARTDGRDKLKKLDKVSEDDVKAAERDLQKAHDDFIGRIDELVKTKEADILEV